MIKNILFFVGLLFLGACSIDEANISGTITNAEDGQWLFLVKLTLNDIEKVDSCQIKNESFSFNYKAVYTLPESMNTFFLNHIQLLEDKARCWIYGYVIYILKNKRHYLKKLKSCCVNGRPKMLR